MRPELVGAAFALGVVVVLLTTPLAVRLAVATGFLDRPHTYKGHASATPYLGGIALVTAVMAVITFANVTGSEVPGALVLGLLGLLVAGTVDDRRNLGPWLRVVLTCGVATGLWAGGVGWDLGQPALDLAITLLWVLAVVNAFNLMDNMDGACASVAAASAATVAVLALAWENEMVAAIAAGTAGACLGFLRYNLARERARIFLGDGGSMPLGMLVAALVMSLSHSARAGDVWFLLAAVPFVGACALDTALVMWSRRRRSVPLWSGGRDHLTHRLHQRTGRRRLVAATLAVAQLLFGALAIALAHAGWVPAIAGVGAYLLMAVLAIRRLESAPWRTAWMDQPRDASVEAQRAATPVRPARAGA